MNVEVRRVEAERLETKADNPWWPIPSWEVPAGVRFDTPRRFQGQIVEVSFGTYGRAEGDECGPYRRITDRSEPAGSNTRYYRRCRPHT